MIPAKLGRNYSLLNKCDGAKYFHSMLSTQEKFHSIVTIMKWSFVNLLTPRTTETFVSQFLLPFLKNQSPPQETNFINYFKAGCYKHFHVRAVRWKLNYSQPCCQAQKKIQQRFEPWTTGKKVKTLPLLVEVRLGQVRLG